jgi:hypothetical protein
LEEEEDRELATFLKEGGRNGRGPAEVGREGGREGGRD